jgi:hypothetical protein
MHQNFYILCYLKLRLANCTEPHYSIAKGMVIYGCGLSLSVSGVLPLSNNSLYSTGTDARPSVAALSQPNKWTCDGGRWRGHGVCVETIGPKHVTSSPCCRLATSRQTTVLTLCYRLKLMEPSIHTHVHPNNGHSSLYPTGNTCTTTPFSSQKYSIMIFWHGYVLREEGGTHCIAHIVSCKM